MPKLEELVIENRMSLDRYATSVHGRSISLSDPEKLIQKVEQAVVGGETYVEFCNDIKRETGRDVDFRILIRVPVRSCIDTRMKMVDWMTMENWGVKEEKMRPDDLLGRGEEEKGLMEYFRRVPD